MPVGHLAQQMKPDQLLTLAGVLLAGYALLPPTRRLDLRLRLHFVDWLLIGGAVLAIHYIAFLAVFQSLRIALDVGRWKWGFTPESASYLILAVTGISVAWHSQNAGLPRRRMKRRRQLI